MFKFVRFPLTLLASNRSLVENWPRTTYKLKLHSKTFIRIAFIASHWNSMHLCRFKFFIQCFIIIILIIRIFFYQNCKSAFRVLAPKSIRLWMCHSFPGTKTLDFIADVNLVEISNMNSKDRELCRWFYRMKLMVV